MRFSDQVAVVTGGIGGLGLSIVRRLAGEGATVIIFDVDGPTAEQVADQCRQSGSTVEAVAVDVTEEASVAKGCAEVADRHGHLDIMVNCAGVLGPVSGKVTGVEAAAFDSTLAVNLRGSFLMTKHAIIEMEKRDYGRVLLVASIAGKEGNAGMVPYSTSKAGVIGLAKTVGKEYAETGITVNALAPAAIWTPMLENADPEAVKYMSDRIPMKRFGTLEEVAATAAWIVSKEASFNTGFTFDMSGGRATY